MSPNCDINQKASLRGRNAHLIVDDSRIMRQIVKRTLNQAGFDSAQYSEAADGYEALEIFKTTSPISPLSDWNMLNMDGLSLHRQCASPTPISPLA